MGVAGNEAPGRFFSGKFDAGRRSFRCAAARLAKTPVAAAALACSGIGIFIICVSDMPVKFIVAAIGCTTFLTAFAILGRRRAHFCAFMLAFCSGIAFQFRVFSNSLMSESRVEILPHTGGAPAEPILCLLDIPLAFLAMLAFSSVFTRRETLPAWSRLDTLIAFFMITSLLSLYNATNLELFFYEYYRICKYVVLYLSLRILLRRQPDISKWLISGLIAALILNDAVGLAQQFFGFQLPINVGGIRDLQTDTLNGVTVARTTGLIGQSNGYAAWLICPLAFAFGIQFIATRPAYKTIALIAFCAGFVALFTTLSRNGWMTFAICVSILVVIASTQGRVKPATIIAIVIPVIGIAWLLSSSEIFQLNIMRFTTDDKGSTSGRIELLWVAVTMIAALPFTGVGLNNFDRVMIHFDPTMISLVFPHPVHNAFLHLAAETGVFSLLFFTGIGVLLLHKSYKLLRNPPGETALLTGLASIAILFSLCFNGMLDWGQFRSDPILAGLTMLAAMVLHFSEIKGSPIASYKKAAFSL